MVGYEARIIESFAEALYAEAKAVVIRHAVLSALAGSALLAAPVVAGGARGGTPILSGVIGALLGLAVGVSSGRTKACGLRLQAQQALCQLQIEKNTRAGVAARVA